MTGALTVMAAALSDVGLRRRANEDACRVSRREGTDTVLAVVADGMGGHGFGHIASGLAVEAIDRYFNDRAPDLGRELHQALLHANRLVYLASVGESRMRGMGTTCTAVAVRRGEAVCAHVGDSRLYLLRGGAIYAMTEDHSQVRDLVARGVITSAEARSHEDRHVLLRALGTEPELNVATWPHPLPLQPGDRLLVSSDGLHGLLADEDIQETLARAASPDAACAALVEQARARGGHDNITAIVLAMATE